MPNSFVVSQQTTIAREIVLNGVGVHSGAQVSMVLHPAEADVGHRFMVTKRGRIVAEIAAERQPSGLRPRASARRETGTVVTRAASPEPRT